MNALNIGGSRSYGVSGVKQIEIYINDAVSKNASVDIASHLEVYLNNVYYGVDSRIKDSDGNLIPIEDIVIKGLMNSHKDKPFHEQIKSVIGLLRYREDPRLYPLLPAHDFPQSADITVLTGVGDCEDFARTVCAYAGHSGYKSYILIMLRLENNVFFGHAVGIVQTSSDTYVAYDISRYVRSNSIEGIARYYMDESNYVYFYLYEFNVGHPINARVKFSREISRPSGTYKAVFYGLDETDLTYELITPKGIYFVIVISIVSLVVFLLTRGR